MVNLTYGIDAMLPIKVGEQTIRRRLEDIDINNVNLKTKLDLIEELRDKAYLREMVCKQITARRYNARLRLRSFQKGDLVWRMTGDARKNLSNQKLTPNWEGPFRIQEDLGNEAYRFQWLIGELIPKTWNFTHL